MKNCKDCGYYKPICKEMADYYEVKQVGGLCQYSSYDGLDKEDSDDVDLLAYASDDSGLMTDLHVGPNFGCVKFIEKK